MLIVCDVFGLGLGYKRERGQFFVVMGLGRNGPEY